MSNQLFVITNDDGICGFYSKLEKAKNELKNIYQETPDYKHFGYRINVYELVNNEYIITNKIYTYKIDTFVIDMISR